MLPKQLAYSTFRVAEIPEYPRFAYTCCDACGLFPLFYPVFAKSAFIRESFFRIHIAGIIGTGSNASLAAYAFVTVDLYGAVFFFIGRPRRTIIHARRIIAVVAELGS